MGCLAPGGAAPAGTGPAAGSGGSTGTSARRKVAQRRFEGACGYGCGPGVRPRSQPSTVPRVVGVPACVPLAYRRCPVGREVTDAQFSALAHVVRAGGPPFADFGVWGPHGNRIANHQRFTQRFLNSEGLWCSRELKGPDSLGVWERFVADVPHGLHHAGHCHGVSPVLHGTAEQKCGSEWWVQEHSRQVDFHTRNIGISASTKRCLGTRHQSGGLCDGVLEGALGGRVRPLRVTGGRERSRTARRASGSKGPPPRQPRVAVTPGPAGKGAASEVHRRRARSCVTPGGQQVCYGWSRGCDAICPHQSAQVCEFCLEPHRRVACPKNPGWKPSTPGRAGKGGKKRHL